MLRTRTSTSARSNGLLMKSLAPHLKRAQLVRRLGGQSQHRQVAFGFDLLQALHDLETIHAGIIRSSRIKS